MRSSRRSGGSATESFATASSLRSAFARLACMGAARAESALAPRPDGADAARGALSRAGAGGAGAKTGGADGGGAMAAGAGGGAMAAGVGGGAMAAGAGGGAMAEGAITAEGAAGG